MDIVSQIIPIYPQEPRRMTIYSIHSFIFSLFEQFYQINFVFMHKYPVMPPIFGYLVNRIFSFILVLLSIAYSFLLIDTRKHRKRKQLDGFKNTYNYRETILSFRKKELLTWEIILWLIGTMFVLSPILGIISDRTPIFVSLFCFYLLIYILIWRFVYEFINQIRLITLSRYYPTSYIIALLIETIYLLEVNTIKDSLHLRSYLSKRIDRIALHFQNVIPSLFSVSDSYERFFFESESKKISNGFRSLKIWLYMPMADTRESLLERLSLSLKLILEGDWSSLPKANSIGDEFLGRVSRKTVILREVRRYVSLFFRAFVPVIVVYLVHFTPINITERTFDYLVTGAFMLSALILLIELDPNLGEKLNLLEQFKKLVSRSDK